MPKKPAGKSSTLSTAPAAADDGIWANHDNIPKDANGVPIFFILPDGVRATYERKLRSAKQVWLATRDPGALRQAAVWIKSHRQPEPEWFFDAIVTLLGGMRSDKDVQRAENNAVHSQRYQIVRDERADALAATGIEISVDEASERAADKFKKLGSWLDFKRSYYKVRGALKQGLGGAFNTIHIPRGQSR
jgi:hypothetical protein